MLSDIMKKRSYLKYAVAICGSTFVLTFLHPTEKLHYYKVPNVDKMKHQQIQIVNTVSSVNTSPTPPVTEARNCPSMDMNSWHFNCTVPCDELPHFNAEQKRVQISIDCQIFENIEYITEDSTVPTLDNQQCLSAYIDRNCYHGYKVPNVVHYIWFSRHQMNFYHFLSAMSASKILKPCLILYHGDFAPFGKYWDYLLRMVKNILHVKVSPPETIFGKPFAFIEHKADVARIQTLQKYGGIYVDADEILLKSLDPLRNYPITLSHAVDFNLSNGLIVSTKNASFLNIWYNMYKTYSHKAGWAYHSTIAPWKIAREHPDLIHVENYTFVRPNYENLDLLFKKNFDWSNNYGIHLYIRFYKRTHDFRDIRFFNTTIGSVSRFILYGTKELCSN